MNFFYKVLLCVVLLPTLSYAQSNYKAGYVVDLKGDTLKGFIDYREWQSNPNSINFKTSIADAKPHQYTPADITFFSINKLEAYISYTGPVSMDATDVDHRPRCPSGDLRSMGLVRIAPAGWPFRAENGGPVAC